MAAVLCSSAGSMVCTVLLYSAYCLSASWNTSSKVVRLIHRMYLFRSDGNAQRKACVA